MILLPIVNRDVFETDLLIKQFRKESDDGEYAMCNQLLKEIAENDEIVTFLMKCCRRLEILKELID